VHDASVGKLARKLVCCVGERVSQKKGNQESGSKTGVRLNKKNMGTNRWKEERPPRRGIFDSVWGEAVKKNEAKAGETQGPEGHRKRGSLKKNVEKKKNGKEKSGGLITARWNKELQKKCQQGPIGGGDQG